MNRNLLVALLLIIVLVGFIAGAASYWSSKVAAVPSITITSPAGGEAWQPGEAHTISWTSSGVPATDKISVTLRRLPPPPLPTEGQEFDPLVFTNLPNTGSTTWTISPSYPGGTYVLDISAYDSVPVTNPVSAESEQFTITHPKLAIDLYPLYTGATWNAATTETVTMGTSTYAGTRMTSAPIDVGMNPASAITPFDTYFDKLLKSHGWHTANDLAAGGHTGGQTGYRNGNGVILTSFSIEYKNRPENAPSECPCTVTFSLFSSGAQN